MTEKLHVQALTTFLKLEGGLATSDARTLSIYLPIRAEGFEASYYDIQMKHMANEYRHKLEKDAAELLDAELGRFKTHLNLVRPAGCPAIAGFSNEAIALLAIVRLPESIEGRIELGPPLLEPLELMLKHHPPTLVAVVDKEQGRTFASILGEVIPLNEFNGQEVRHSKAGGTSAPSNQRKADNRARANLKQVATGIQAAVRRDGFTRIYIGGPDEARAALIRELPKQVAPMVRGTISAELDLPDGRLLNAVREQMIAAAS